MKKSNKKKLKEKLWRLTSEYVRRRDSDEFGNANCVTCGLVKHWKELQAGHFIPRAQGLAAYFDLRNVHPQCHRCNIHLGGNGPEYYPYMLDRYGPDTVEELRRLSGTVIKLTEQDYRDMIEDIQKKLEELDHEGY